jgi:hypothetical protein
MLSLALVLLQFQAELSHAFAAFTRLYFVRLFAFGSSFGTSLLVQLLFATLTLPLKSFDDVDSAAPHWCIANIAIVVVVVSLKTCHTADEKAATTR